MSGQRARVWLGWGLLGGLLAVLAWRAGDSLVRMVTSFALPFSLDYGEGIVLQQALLILGPGAYGDITQYPFIVFHYPPVYHLLVRLVAAFGIDIVIAGRLVSIASTLATLSLVAAMAATLIGDSAPSLARRIGAFGAALLVIASPIVGLWAPLARVDMLAVALSLGAVLLASRSAGSKVRLDGAIVLAVLAVFTKQTSVAAPAAIVFALLLMRPRDGVRAMVVGLGLGGVLFAGASIATDGGFFRHLESYNMNRFSLERLGDLLLLLGFVGLATQMLLATLALMLARRKILAVGWRSPARRSATTRDRQSLLLLMLMIHLAISTLMLALMGKSGSSVNYAIEWLSFAAVAVGFVLAWLWSSIQSDQANKTVPWALLLVLLLALNLLIAPLTEKPAYAAALQRDRQALVEEIRASGGPVISDDMVLLLRAGQTIPWEPAIFAELAHGGLWDERLILDMIRARRFTMILTHGNPGERLFDSRYNPAVAHAIAEAHPRREERLGGMILRRPAE